MKMKLNIHLISIITLLLITFSLLMGCDLQQNVGFVNPYDLVSAANSFDKTELMQELELSLTSLGQVIIATETTTGQ